MAVLARIRQAWNAFRGTEDPFGPTVGVSTSISSDASRSPRRYYNDRTIITSVTNRISMDVASLLIKHVKVDEFGRYSEDMRSPLNYCLTLEPNLDQGPTQFRQDIAMTLFDHGAAVIVPVDTTIDPETNATFDIFSLRVGNAVDWYPKHVKVSLWNENKGLRQEITLEKRIVAIIQNPLYAVMNEPSGTLQRLLRKLTLFDAVDEQVGSGKLDLIIQLPYLVKTETRRKQAETRREDIEFQLSGSKYGIAYIDGTEKITQLNRPAENNLLKSVEFLTTMLYGQLGITEDVLNGTADESAMNNYFARTVEPIVDAIVEGMRRAFLGPIKIIGGEDIKYFRNLFKFVPMKDMADIIDKTTRNEVFTSNEIRQLLGFAPSKDPKADQLINSNMPQPEDPRSLNPKEGNQNGT